MLSPISDQWMPDPVYGTYEDVNYIAWHASENSPIGTLMGPDGGYISMQSVAATAGESDAYSEDMGLDGAVDHAGEYVVLARVKEDGTGTSWTETESFLNFSLTPGNLNIPGTGVTAYAAFAVCALAGITGALQTLCAKFNGFLKVGDENLDHNRYFHDNHVQMLQYPLYFDSAYHDSKRLIVDEIRVARNVEVGNSAVGSTAEGQTSTITSFSHS